MKKSLRDAWTAALRSGEYKQGKSYFKRGNKFCCLGVLCVVSDVDPVNYVGAGNWPHTESILNTSVGSMRLASMNDEGKTFPEIADWIEANIPVEAD